MKKSLFDYLESLPVRLIPENEIPKSLGWKGDIEDNAWNRFIISEERKWNCRKIPIEEID